MPEPDILVHQNFHVHGSRVKIEAQEIISAKSKVNKTGYNLLKDLWNRNPYFERNMGVKSFGAKAEQTDRQTDSKGWRPLWYCKETIR